MSDKIRLENVLKTANNWANRRISLLKKPSHPLIKTNFKVNEKLFYKEVKTAAVLGELSALERLLHVLLKNPELTREDIEAELHISIKDYNNYIASEIGQKDLETSLDEILLTRGYIK